MGISPDKLSFSKGLDGEKMVEKKVKLLVDLADPSDPLCNVNADWIMTREQRVKQVAQFAELLERNKEKEMLQKARKEEAEQ